MARKQEAETLLRQGMYPSQIARSMGVSDGTVITYLRLRVGEGFLRLSDLFFSYPREKRKILEEAGRKRFGDTALLRANDLSRDDLDLFRSLKNFHTFAGDLYEYICVVEVAIHELVRAELQREFGPAESGWWRKGIPEQIRSKCVSRREEDGDPADSPYAYTTLIDLVVVVSKNWPLFQRVLPEHYRVNRKQFESDLTLLNRIRNSVMHPAKQRRWSKEDFAHVRQVCGYFSQVKLGKTGVN